MGKRGDDIRRARQLAEQIVIDKSKAQFYPFMRYVSGFKGAMWNWHHKYVCSVLEDFAYSRVTNLMVFMPPQHQKTFCMTLNLPAFLLGLNPDTAIMVLAYSETLSSSFNRSIQRIITGDKYQKVFPNTKLNTKNVSTDSKGAYIRNSSEFEIVDHTGFLKTAGVGAGIAGRPAKVALLDDVIKNVAEAESKTYRDKLYNWYTDELEARLHNDSKVAFTITRRHQDDLAGRLLKRDGSIEEGGKWKVVTLPALKENNNDPKDPREIGEALFPQLHSRERMESIRDKNPSTFNSLYQQRPTLAGGELVKKGWLTIIDEAPFGGTVKFTQDTAYTSNTKNDPSAILAYKVIQNTLFVIDYVRDWVEYPELERLTARTYTQHKTEGSIIYIENKASGMSLKQSLAQKFNINAALYKLPKGDKISRLNVVLPYLESGRVKLLRGAWNQQFIEECTAFPKGTHDEAIDTLVMAINKGLKGGQGGMQSHITTVFDPIGPDDPLEENYAEQPDFD